MEPPVAHVVDVMGPATAVRSRSGPPSIESEIELTQTGSTEVFITVTA